ncbi:pirin [Cupriavidus basilensis OR16]|uniref:Pirin n=1 Tax=Cupriavidus basilensis OR16 TaxID=1127483 RepID=H1S7R4_9BURK|nr:pirin [Cupriavidus basilensis OR16]
MSRLLPAAATQTVGPFIFFDHMGPVAMLPGEGADVRPHPHIGLATVTYLFEGEILHHDSLGSKQVIRPGDVNWMTAGSGIAHSERSPQAARDAGPRLHGIQTWVALPKEHENVEPSFHHHPAATLPKLERPGVRMTVIAGDAFGAEAPVKVFSRTLYVAIELEAGASLEIPAEHAERGIYPVDGSIALDGEVLPVSWPARRKRSKRLPSAGRMTSSHACRTRATAFRCHSASAKGACLLPGHAQTGLAQATRVPCCRQSRMASICTAIGAGTGALPSSTRRIQAAVWSTSLPGGNSGTSTMEPDVGSTNVR